MFVNSSFQNYKSGIFNCNSDNSDSVNHAVTLVGQTYVSLFTSYWIVKNSWGTGWGNQGYIWIQLRPNPSDCNISKYGYQAKFSN